MEFPQPRNHPVGGLHETGFDLTGTELEYLEQRSRFLILLAGRMVLRRVVVHCDFYREDVLPPVLRDSAVRRADEDAVVAPASIFCQSKPNRAICSCSAVRR